MTVFGPADMWPSPSPPLSGQPRYLKVVRLLLLPPVAERTVEPGPIPFSLTGAQFTLSEGGQSVRCGAEPKYGKPNGCASARQLEPVAGQTLSSRRERT